MGPAIRREKLLLARALSATGVSAALLHAQTLLHPRGYVRVVNYHGTPPESADAFARQVAFYADHFSPVTPGDLERYFRDRRWVAPRPGLIISFDDGLRTNFDVAAPVLERFGFTGWFFVPVGFIDEPAEQQTLYARDHMIQAGASPSDGRVAMSWDELRALARRHVVGCHTRTHLRLAATVAPARLEDEIVTARRDLEARLEHPVDSFCWVGGEERSYSAEAARVVRRAGYRYAFMTNNAPLATRTDPLQIQRTNIEADWPVDVVRFQLSGVMDALYAPKRGRVNALTAR